MPFINLFGLQLSLDDAPSLRRPEWVTEVRRWNTQLVRTHLHLDIHIVIEGTWYLELQGEFTLAQSDGSPDEWVFRKVLKHGVFKFTELIGDPGNPRFELRAAWISSNRAPLSRTKFKILDDGYLGIAMPKIPFQLSKKYPLESYSTGDAAMTLVLDPKRTPKHIVANKRSLWFDRECFAAETFLKIAAPGPDNRLFLQRWISSAPTVLALSELSDAPNLRLTAQGKGDGYLALHGFRWGAQEFSPCIGVTAPAIELSMASYRSPGPAGTVSVPAGILHAYTLQETTEEPVSWAFGSAKSPLRLAHQAITGIGSLASLVVDPSHTDASGLPLRREGAGSAVRGVRSNIRFQIGKRAQLEVNRIGPDGRVGGPIIRPRSFKQVNYAKAGAAYLAGNESIVDTWTFSGAGGVLPLLTDEAAQQVEHSYRSTHGQVNELSGIEFRDAYFDAINAELRRYSDTTRPSVHESAMVMGEATAGNTVALQNMLSANKAPNLTKFTTDYRYGVVRFTQTWKSGEIPDFFVVTAKNAVHIDKTFSLDQASASGQQVRVTRAKPDGLDTESGGKVYAVVKLERGKTVAQILQDANVVAEQIVAIEQQMPDQIASSAWIGCILFQQKLDLGKFPLLQSIVDGDLSLQYLALSPNRETEGLKIKSDAFSVDARVLYTNTTAPSAHPDDKIPGNDMQPRKEVLMQTRKVDITWSGRQLSAFHVEVAAQIRTCFGRRKNARGRIPEPTTLAIVGAMDSETETIRFLARGDKPIPLLPEDGFGPIGQVWAKRLEILRVGDQSKVDIDGDIDFQTLGWGGSDWFAGVDGIDFQGFGFRFPTLNKEGSWLEFDYPSFRLRLGRGGHELLGLPSFNLKLKSLGIDFPDSGFDWNASLPLLPGNLDWDNTRNIAGRFRLGLEIFKLPKLSTKAFDSLKFDFDVGIPFKDPLHIDLANMRVHLSAVGFRRLNIQLMRFLALRAESVELTAKDFPELSDQQVPWISMRGVELDILDKRIIKDLDFDFFSVPDGKKGFLGILKQETKLGIIRIQWMIIGKEIVVPDSFAKAVISIRSDWEDNLDAQLQDAYDNNELIPLGLVNGRPIGDWLFAAGLDVMDNALSGKFLFQDNAYYGIALEGDLLDKWFGYDFGIAVLYIQRDRPEEDSFYIEFRVPLVSLGVVAIKGGVIALEIQMNGGFLLDVGFPWLDDNGVRDWDRSPSSYVSGLLGKSGLYVAKRSTVREVQSRRGTLTMFAAGKAMMVGIGGAYSRGPFHVEAWAGIYAVAEGAILLRRLEVMGLRVVGAVGIQVRGVGELNWWIISIRIEVLVAAEARLTLYWGIAFHPVTGEVALPDADVPDGDFVVQLDFNLYARVNAEACIGKGWFKICKGISAGVALPYRQRLVLGQ